MSKTTRYTLTAAIGDALPGASIDLTDEQAESPLYASRISLLAGGSSDAQAEADAIIADAQAEAKRIVEAAQAEAMKLAAAPKK